MFLPLDGGISACLKGHSQLNESNVGLVPHGDVRAVVCSSNLLRECILLVTQVNSDTRGGWKVLNQEGVDGLQDCVVSCVVPSLLQGIGAGIEDVDQGLTLAAEIAGWGWQLLPHVQVSSEDLGYFFFSFLSASFSARNIINGAPSLIL